MVVTGPQVHVAAQGAARARLFAAHDHQHLGVRLVTDDAVDDVRTDLLELGRPADVGFLVEARHQFDDDGDLLAVLGGAQQRLHQHRVGAGTVDGHLDRHHLRVGRRLLEQFDDRGEALVGMMQQDVAGGDRGKDVVPLLQRLGQAGAEGTELEVVALHPVGYLHQAHQIDRAGDAVEVGVVQVELRQQELGHRVRAVVGDLEAHAVAKVALREFALDLGAQVLDFFLVDEEVAVARHAELVTAEHGHSGKQFADEGVQYRREEDEAVLAIAQALRQADDARQHARSLHDRRPRAAPEGVLALEFDGEVEALVEHAREGVRRVEADRRQHRHDFAEEIVPDPLELHLAPVAAPDEADSLGSELGQDLVVEQRVLFVDQRVRLVADQRVGGTRRQAVGGDRDRVELELLLEPGDTDLEELVEIAAHDAQETQPLEQRRMRILGLRQHAAVERQDAELAVEEILGRKVREVEFVGVDA